MISCKECLMWMEHETDLNDMEREEMLSHLTLCESCRAVYDALTNVDTWFREEEMPPEGFADSVMAVIRHERKEKYPLALLKRYRFTAVAAVAAILVLVVSSNMPKHTEDLSVARSTVAVAGGTTSDAIIAAYDGGVVEDVYADLAESGCSGQLVVVEEDLPDLQKLFPKGQELTLKNGEVLLVLNYDEFDQNIVTISQIQILPDGGEKLIYLYHAKKKLFSHNWLNSFLL